MLSVLCNYHYDPLDRLTSDSSPSTPVRHRFYCKSRLATEIQGAIACSIVQHDAQLLAQQQRHATALDTTLLATDLQRSVLHTLNNDTQSQPIAYSPYGHRPAENGLLSLLGFNGERPDPVTGHYLLGNGYRAFNPVLMRFVSPDSLSPFGKGGLNQYVYCLADPINREDSNGHISFRAVVKHVIFANRLKAQAVISRQLRALTTIASNRTPHPPIINAIEQLTTAKNNSISLKKLSLNKVESLGAIKLGAHPPQAFKDAKAAVANLYKGIDLAREQHVSSLMEAEFSKRGMSKLESGTANEPLPPLSPTSKKLFFDNLDKLIDTKIANLRHS